MNCVKHTPIFMGKLLYIRSKVQKNRTDSIFHLLKVCVLQAIEKGEDGHTAVFKKC